MHCTRGGHVISRTLARALVLTAVLGGVSSRGVSAQTMTGNWVAEYPSHMSGGDGEANIDAMGHADVAFVQTGDSIRGVWHSQESNATSRHVAGTMKRSHLSIVTDAFEATTHGGDGSPIMVRVYYEGDVKDGQITGTMRVRTEDGSIELAPVKWTAHRTPSPTKQP